MPEIEKPFRKTGEAAISESPLHPRRKSHRIMVGPVPVGGGAPISVQSMTNTLTANVPATLQQIAELTAAGCDIVRVAVPSQDDADALPEIVKKSPIPVIADIHFQSKYVFQAIDAGCAAVRVNPGNIRKFDEVGPSICKAATDAGISLRIGVNAGSGFFVLLAACAFPNAFGLAPVAAFLGALCVAGLIFAVAGLGGSSRLTVVLAGMAFTAIFTAGMNTILIVNPDAYVGASGFLVGGLSGVKLSEVIVPGCAICVVLVLGLLQGARLNLLSLGEHQAHSLGLNVRRTRLTALVSAAALAGCAVSFAGLVGFVGLIVPHAVRALVGHDNRRVLAMAPLLGGLLVCLCDLLARTMFAPYEIPVGIVLSLLGGPFFVYLILRRGKGGLNG